MGNRKLTTLYYGKVLHAYDIVDRENVNMYYDSSEARTLSEDS